MLKFDKNNFFWIKLESRY